MKKRDQEFTEKGKGDCMRAVLASLFGLELIQVPHFLMFSNEDWFNVYYYFLYSLGYDYLGRGKLDTHDLAEQETISRGISVTVPSKNLGPGTTHNVIVNSTGMVIHDPHPKKNYQDVNIISTNELIAWDIINRRK